MSGAVTGGAAVAPLLEQAIGYAGGAVHAVTPELLSRPTPCQGWDLGMLLAHANESLAALLEGVTAGSIALLSGPPGPGGSAGACAGGAAGELVRAFRLRAGLLLRCSGAAGGGERVIAIGGQPLMLDTMAAAGAVEIAVHGWDISRACGLREPVPDALATDLLELAWLLVPLAGRSPLFAPPVPLPRAGSPGELLVAFLGRDPR